jgi:hypothetical protein
MTYRIFYGAFLCLFMGCNNFSSLEDIELPTHTSKLVVFANLEYTTRRRPDNVQTIYIGKTRSTFDTSRSFYTRDSFFRDSFWSYNTFYGTDTVNATAELFKNGQLFATFKRAQSDDLSYYFLDKKIELDGATYKLRVSAAGFETVESEQVMPPLITLDSAKFLRKGFVYKDLILYPDAYEFLCFFKDTAMARPNYYWLLSQSGIFDKRLINLDPTVNGDVLSDKTFNGKSFAWHIFYKNTFKDNPSNITFKMYSTTEAALLFEQSAALNKSSENNRFAEPTTLYSNIKNGYGLFTLSAVSEFYLKF